MPSIPFAVSFKSQEPKSSLLDHKTDVVVTCKINSKLDMFDCRRIDGVRWKAGDLAERHRLRDIVSWQRTWVPQLPLTVG
jgi:hypothetical protein